MEEGERDNTPLTLNPPPPHHFQNDESTSFQFDVITLHAGVHGLFVPCFPHTAQHIVWFLCMPRRNVNNCSVPSVSGPGRQSHVNSEQYKSKLLIAQQALCVCVCVRERERESEKREIKRVNERKRGCELLVREREREIPSTNPCHRHTVISHFSRDSMLIEHHVPYKPTLLAGSCRSSVHPAVVSISGTNCHNVHSRPRASHMSVVITQKCQFLIFSL